MRAYHMQCEITNEGISPIIISQIIAINYLHDYLFYNTISIYGA